MKVVCVHRFLHGIGIGYGDETLPQKGGTYTIRGIVDRPGHPNCETGLLLEEISNRVRGYQIVGVSEPSFSASCFRPVIERKTDIGFAHEILRKVTTRVDA